MGVGVRIQGSAAGVHACMCAHVSSWSWRLVLTAEISCDCWVKLQQCRTSVLTFVVLDGQIAPGGTYRIPFFFQYIFSDGEIISQIKMTNIALAEIKELLKQQVKTHVRQIGLRFKGKKNQITV